MQGRRLRRVGWVEDLTGEPRTKIYRWEREGLIPSVRVGRSVYFDEFAVLAWLNQGGSTERSGEPEPRDARGQ
jgi:excisionase family DNA binding protein